MVAAYTCSDAIDDTSGYETSTNRLRALNPYNFALKKGDSPVMTLNPRNSIETNTVTPAGSGLRQLDPRWKRGGRRYQGTQLWRDPLCIIRAGCATGREGLLLGVITRHSAP
jgi:hypothetical protein